MKRKYLQTIFVISLSFLITQCRITDIIQPEVVLPGEVVVASINVAVDLVPEPNPHKGVLCILIPQDWSFISGTYTSVLGNGILEISPEWADSAEACYPAAQFGEGMHWVGLISDTGYTYQNPFTIDITVQMQAGQGEGCYDLGYLVTKATSGLICSGNPAWAPLSYPNTISVSGSGAPCDTLKVERSPEWENLFDRTSGWTGADGIYSIPLSGQEVPGDTGETTVFLFSDTFIGEVDSNNHRQNATLVNNTYAVLDGNQPNEENIDFFWATNQNNQPNAVFVPDTSYAGTDDWFWLMDGVALNDSIYAFGLRLQPGSGGIFNFEIVGVSLISFVLDSSQVISEYRQKDTPIYYRNENEGWEIVFGQAVMPLTLESANPDPDGYIYIYGPKNSIQGKELVAARVFPQFISDFSQWRYWDGSDWTTGVENCQSITNGISQEFSVTPLGNGQYILVFQIGSSVGVRFGESPTGPFGVMRFIYDCPEVLEDPDIFVYNAKAHPHLSTPGELLISYNVNTFDFWDHFTNADIYRPRFITLTLPEDSSVAVGNQAEYTPQRFSLFQNFPNPFNPSTTIAYEIAAKSKVVLKIYNILGQEVRVLVNNHQIPGKYTVSWDGKDDRGKPVSSGMYIYRIQAGDKSQSRKMLLLK
jgi:hypothetical protein